MGQSVTNNNICDTSVNPGSEEEEEYINYLLSKYKNIQKEKRKEE